jgi:enoyl-CoA hydratase
MADRLAELVEVRLRLAQGSRGGFEVALQWEALAQPVTMAAADIHEGIRALREHRPPAFEGS